MIFELYIEDILREVDILNHYRGEAAKRKDADAVVMQSAQEQHDALMYHLRTAVTDVRMLANPRVYSLDADISNEKIVFDLSPLRENAEHIVSLLKEGVRQYLVYEIRRLWLSLVRPDWADNSMRMVLLQQIQELMRAAVKAQRVRRRCTDLAGI